MTGPIDKFVSDTSTAIRAIEQVARSLDHLGDAFYTTGNRIVAERLSLEARTLRAQAKALEPIIGSVVDYIVRSADQASKNMLNAALAGAELADDHTKHYGRHTPAEIHLMVHRESKRIFVTDAHGSDRGRNLKPLHDNGEWTVFTLPLPWKHEDGSDGGSLLRTPNDVLRTLYPDFTVITPEEALNETP